MESSRTMAEFTPPSSLNNTPQRPLTAEDEQDLLRPPSPSALAAGGRHPLSSSMDVDSEDEDEDEERLDAGAEMDSDEELAAAGGAGAGAGAGAGEDQNMGDGDSGSADDSESDLEGLASGARGGTKQGGAAGILEALGIKHPRARGSKRKSKRSARKARPVTGPAGGTPDSRVSRGTIPTPQPRRDGDLYESEIVARWNAEFGDVCALPKSKIATTASSNAPAANVAPAPALTT